jgi:hypothetical protein
VDEVDEPVLEDVASDDVVVALDDSDDEALPPVPEVVAPEPPQANQQLTAAKKGRPMRPVINGVSSPPRANNLGARRRVNIEKIRAPRKKALGHQRPSWDIPVQAKGACFGLPRSSAGTSSSSVASLRG